MATRKVVEEVQEAAVQEAAAPEVQEAAVQEPAAEPAKPSKVKIIVPMDPLCEESDSIFVSVNGMNYQIKRGVEVEVPAFIAEVYLRSVEGDAKAQAAAQAIRRQMEAAKAI